jgi:hypothetical protein
MDKICIYRRVYVEVGRKGKSGDVDVKSLKYCGGRW